MLHGSMFVKPSNDGFLLLHKKYYRINFFLLHLIKKYYILTSISNSN